VTSELVSEPRVVPAKKGRHEASAPALAPSVAEILGLQTLKKKARTSFEVETIECRQVLRRLLGEHRTNG
jgi:hypothetical protein